VRQVQRSGKAGRAVAVADHMPILGIIPIFGRAHAALVTATAAGLYAAGEVPPTPSTPAERLALWCDRLPSPAPQMLRTVAAEGERYIDADELATVLGKKPSGGALEFRNRRVAQ
jgi:hypothetical protein